MEVTATFEPNIKTEKALDKLPDDILYIVARETLDLTDSLQYFPVLSGDLERSSMSNGVRECSGGYYIGSFTDYSSHVWNLPQETTNWTNPTTKSHWYAYTLKTYGQLIIDTAVNHAWKEDM